MASRPSKRGFACVAFGVPAPSPDIRVAFIPVAEALVPTLAADLMKKLARPLPEMPADVAAKIKPGDVVEAPEVAITVDFAGYPPLYAEVRRFGQTAAMVTWVHRVLVEVGTGARTGTVQAVSLYLTGLDRAADNLAIDRASKKRYGSGGHPLPVPAAAYAQLRADPQRPLAVQVFCQPLARLDPSIRCGFVGMGTAFFGVFGVDEADEEPSPSAS